MENELKKPVSFRPSDYDAIVLERIQKENPQITNVSDLLRLALRMYVVRQEEIEARQSEIEIVKSEVKELKEAVLKLALSQK